MKLCNRLFSYKLEHDASHLTDLSLHSEPCELKQCKRNERTKLPPVATKYRCTTTSHCFNVQVQHATMLSTTGALRSSCKFACLGPSWLPGWMTTITITLSMSHAFSSCYVNSHTSYQKSSVPWCCVWQMAHYFTLEKSTKVHKNTRCHDAVTDIYSVNLLCTFRRRHTVDSTRYLILLWKFTRTHLLRNILSN